MIKKVEIQQGRNKKTCLELTLFAFKTSKGTFTLSGSNANGTDEWKHLETRTFHTWTREQVYHWFLQGKITPVSEAKALDWYNNSFKKRKGLKTR